jgi:hypothetical protein
VRTSYGKPSTRAARAARAAQALTGGHLQDRLAGTCASVAVLGRPFDGQQNSREPTEVEIPLAPPRTTPALQSAQWPIVSRSALLSRRPPYLNLPALYIRRSLFLSSRLFFFIQLSRSSISAIDFGRPLFESLAIQLLRSLILQRPLPLNSTS